MSFASTRSRRANAGNRLRELIERELAQQAAATPITADSLSLGEAGPSRSETSALLEEEEDVDFEIQNVPETETGDIVDSDFSESSEEASADEAERIAQEEAEDDTKRAGRRATRHSTRSASVMKKMETERIIQEFENRKSRHTKRERHEEEPLTQEMLLAEARETEKVNTAALQAFRLQEAQKKQRKAARRTLTGPVISFKSTTVPCVSVVTNEESKAKPPPETAQDTTAMVTKNYLSFSNAKTSTKDVRTWWPFYPAFSPTTVCPITGLPARYRDPHTGIPYANTDAFRILQSLGGNKYWYSPPLKAIVQHRLP
ncbi:Vacuolar protein sorting-associated protein 72 [Dispira parvispora]|uniref:Vacuolar protein sorting-associated protein 72 n=1 Tax=Dispira parvispora TaxID=1520584 RepID=A0A9W8AU40_9FUNG|nr:Vacuolar protein sorting-associated protein 72 [Dispira parvispora]